MPTRIRTFLLALLLPLLWFTPAFAQTTPPLVFTPKATPATVSAGTLVYTPGTAGTPAANAQIAALTNLDAALAAQVSALNAALAAQKIPLGAAYTNKTGRLFTLHHQMSDIAYGDDGTGAGSISGYVNLIHEAMAAGADGLSCDYGSDSTAYHNSLLHIYAAANQVNAADGWTGTHIGTTNAKSVGKFSLYVVFDFSNPAIENTQSILNVLTPVLHDPANLTIGGNPATGVGGRPVWSCYTGGGGRSWASLAAIFGPAVTQLTVGGIRPYGIWGGEVTHSDGTIASYTASNITAWATGCVRPFADAVWSFPSGSTPVGPSSGIPNQETLAAGVHAAGLAFQGALNPQYGQQSNSSARYIEDFCGGEGLRAQWRSILDVQKPELGVQFCTADDLDEQSNLLNGNVVAGQPVWVGYRQSAVSGYYKDKSGLVADNDNYVQELKTGQKPVYTTDRIIAHYQTMTGAALANPTADPRGGIAVQDNDETIIGTLQLAATNRQVIYVTCYLASGGYVKLTQDNGVTVQRYAPAGGSTLRLPFVAGSVKIELDRSGAAVLTMTGEPILATAAVANANNFTMWAHN